MELVKEQAALPDLRKTIKTMERKVELAQVRSGRRGALTAAARWTVVILTQRACNSFFPLPDGADTHTTDAAHDPKALTHFG